MDRMSKKRKGLQRRHQRLRQKVRGTPDRPRLAVYRSLRHVYAQVIDDINGKTIASVSSQSEAFGKDVAGGNIDAAKKVGMLIAEKAKALSITKVVFDRGGRQYHGRVRALAEGAREGGLEF